MLSHAHPLSLRNLPSYAHLLPRCTLDPGGLHPSHPSAVRAPGRDSCRLSASHAASSPRAPPAPRRIRHAAAACGAVHRRHCRRPFRAAAVWWGGGRMRVKHPEGAEVLLAEGASEAVHSRCRRSHPHGSVADATERTVHARGRGWAASHCSLSEARWCRGAATGGVRTEISAIPAPETGKEEISGWKAVERK